LKKTKRKRATKNEKMMKIEGEELNFLFKKRERE